MTSRNNKIELVTGFVEQKPIGNSEFGVTLGVWAEKCEYNCQVKDCDFKSRRLCFLAQHIKGCHEIDTLKEYEGQYGSAMTATNYYECELCRVKIVHNWDTLRAHMKAHATSINSYFKQYIQKTGGKEVKTNTHTLQRWADNCEYQCKAEDCEYTTNRLRNLADHIKGSKKHKLKTIEEYEAKYGPAMTSKAYLKCEMCNNGNQILHTWDTIKGHMENMHNSGIKKYYKKYVLKIGEENPSEPTVKCDNENNLKNTSKVEAMDVTQGDAKRGMDVKERKLAEESERRFSGRLLFRWAENCDYRCQVKDCDHEAGRLSHLTRHIKESHKINSIKEYEDKYGSAMTGMRHYECEICQWEMVHNSSTIKTHMETKHNTDLKSYYKKYILKLGENDATLASEESKDNKFDFPLTLVTEDDPNDKGNNLTKGFEDDSNVVNAEKECESQTVDSNTPRPETDSASEDVNESFSVSEEKSVEASESKDSKMNIDTMEKSGNESVYEQKNGLEDESMDVTKTVDSTLPSLQLIPPPRMQMSL